MALLGVRTLTLRYGGDAPLLDGVGFYVQRGERIGLLGRNGTGKSSLLKILSGDVKPDGGEVVLQAGTRVARLAQEVPRDLRGDVFDVVAGGLPELGSLLSDYHHWSSRLAQGDGSEADLARLEDVQHRLEGAGGWDLHRRVESTLSRLGLPAEGRFETLSGGMSRRVLLARTLLSEPDLLLLDEPTNHLDIPAIEWLEEMLRSFQGAILFVTHDRAFLRGLATRILEIDRGRIDDFPGDYPRYLERRQAQMEAELAQHDRFDKKLAQEEAWIRQGIKARRTRNEGRVRALEKLREERRARRVGKGQARFAIEGAERSGKRVIETEGLTFSWAGRPMVKGLSTTICRGDKVGLLGPNGSGKTTLLRLLLGELEPEAGTVEHGTRLEVAYFDQLREQLDEDQSVADSVANGADQVEVGGRRRHVISYLQDFLFPAAQVRSPVSSLSGGERNRLLLARLFTRPCNLLVMDEPTNDLDIETLELLEALLVEYEGTLLVVSHDRTFLDHVVTSTLVMEGFGRVGDYAGGYTDWLSQRPQAKTDAAPAAKPKAQKAEKPRSGRRRLSYKERRDLESLPERIEALEEEQGTLHGLMADPELYKRDDAEEIARAQTRLKDVEQELELAYERWTELETLAEAAG